MNKKAVLIAVMGLLLMLLPFGVAMGQNPGGTYIAGFTMSAATDRDRYMAGETTQISARICRVLPWPVSMSSTGGANAITVFRLIDTDGEVVVEPSPSLITMELRHVGWWPGQCRTTVNEWDQRGIRGNRGRQRRHPPPVAAGRYYAEVRWLAARWPNVPVPQSPVRTAPFTIAPGVDHDRQ